ncbi:MAG: hypothetical protein RL607_2266 [Bacteroidota bacterium]
MKKISYFFCIISTSIFAQVNITQFVDFQKYQSENKTLLMQESQSRKTVLLGDSITEFWKVNDPNFFTQNNLIDRGISGQTTTQMLLRFRQDVIDLKPQTVVILAGVNDIAQNAGPIEVSQIFDNLKSMVDLAKANHIQPILCLVVPANRFPWRPEIIPMEKISQLNSLIKNYAISNKIQLVDYFTPLKDAELGLDAKYGDDGVHPNLAGYKVMEKALLAVLNK